MNPDISDDYDYDLDYYQQINCYCKRLCPFDDDEGVCSVSGGKCFTSLELVTNENGKEEPLLSYGCMSAGQMGFMQCKGSQVPHAEPKSILCCDNEDFCNKDLHPTYIVTATHTHEYEPSFTFIMFCSTLLSSFAVIVIALIIYFVYKRTGKRKKKKNDCQLSGSIMDEKIGGNLDEIITDSCDSGSGLPMMVQRTIAKQIEMGDPVGRGRYGEVLLAKWREENVAVKVFYSTEEKSWLRETEIYQTVLMRHDNILGFIAADITGDGGCTQLLLVTEYHDRGSLYDFLQENTLSVTSLLTMCVSIASGLTHLHSEIFGKHGKPSIAHRDIKSKNILVKSNGECCIADFGMAVKFSSNDQSLDVPIMERTGTKRYMAPEILNQNINLNSFSAYKAVDMYACGLVFWEMAKRCEVGNGPGAPYELPFQYDVPSDPSFEQMHEVVCIKKIRPIIPEEWEDDEVLNTLVRTIQELWHENPAVRLTALRVKKTLNKLESSEDITVELE